LDEAIKDVGKAKILNTAKAGSVGGRNGTSLVSFMGNTYYRAEGLRIASAFYGIQGFDIERFFGRVNSYLGQGYSFEEAVNKAVPAEYGGQKVRKDAILYKLDGSYLALRVIAYLLDKNEEALKSKLRREKILGQKYDGTDLRLLLDGKIKPKNNAVGSVDVFLQAYTGNFPNLTGVVTNYIHNAKRKSWKGLARELNLPDSSLKFWAAKYENNFQGFWSEVNLKYIP